MTFGILHLRRDKCLDIMAMTTDEFLNFFLIQWLNCKCVYE